MRVVVISVGGNFHNAKAQLNRNNMGEYLVTMDFTGSLTMVVLKMPEAKFREFVKAKILSEHD